jgi:mono/diheme cytochrome c family protein
MKLDLYRVTWLACALAAVTASLAQQPRIDVGKVEYEAPCAICHGVGGKGNASRASS